MGKSLLSIVVSFTLLALVSSIMVPGNIRAQTGQSVAVATSTSATLNPIVMSNSGVTYPFTFRFTIVATSQHLYVSKTSSLIQSVATNNIGIQYPNVMVTPSTVTGDGAQYYIIPTGTSRSFIVYGVARKGNPGDKATVEINQIYYGVNSDDLQYDSIVEGLENLKLGMTFPALTTTNVPPMVSIPVIPSGSKTAVEDSVPLTVIKPLQNLINASNIWDAVRLMVMHIL